MEPNVNGSLSAAAAPVLSQQCTLGPVTGRPKEQQSMQTSLACFTLYADTELHKRGRERPAVKNLDSF